MSEINIARTISNKRKEKEITQEELATYIGVSKASVSKWETGQSYPDITFLPLLASYFNISIDSLMGYEPQLSKEDIKKMYHHLSSEFTKKTFDEVLGKVNEITKKYFSCFPLLLQMGILIINHAELAQNDKRAFVIDSALTLFNRIRAESENIELCKEATILQAVCYLSLSKPNGVLAIYNDSSKTVYDESSIVATAYMMTGQVQKANATLQISIYQSVLILLQSAIGYLQINMQNHQLSEDILSKTLSICNAFDIKHLHPTTMLSVCLISAQNYALNGNTEQALNMLDEYTDLATNNLFPLTLKGDYFFTEIDAWLQDLDLGNATPRNERTIKQGIITTVTSNHIFDGLKDNFRYKNIIKKLSAYFENEQTGVIYEKNNKSPDDYSISAISRNCWWNICFNV